jgi:hypothetical protein
VFYVGKNANPADVINDLADAWGWTPEQVASDSGIMAQLQQAFSTPEGAAVVPNPNPSPVNWLKANWVLLAIGGAAAMIFMRR